ncbi:MAG TPA: hypothetical protein VFI13_10555 [Gemmatimonadales bacterium]|nr:hypothetical protein [Gemmatimonadales bacterium]
MTNGISTTILVVAIAISSIIRRTERGMIDELEGAGAVTPDKAIALRLDSFLRKMVFRRLRGGGVGETPEGKQYLDVVAYSAYRWRRVKRGLIAAAGVVVIGLAFYYFKGHA